MEALLLIFVKKNRVTALSKTRTPNSFSSWMGRFDRDIFLIDSTIFFQSTQQKKAETNETLLLAWYLVPVNQSKKKKKIMRFSSLDLVRGSSLGARTRE
jgi:hypothetical protein